MFYGIIHIFTAVMGHYPKHVKILGFHFDIFQDTNFRNT